MSNVIKFYTAANPDHVLDAAKGVYQQVLIIGYDKDGFLDARASHNFIDGGDILWAIEKFKADLLNGVYGENE